MTRIAALVCILLAACPAHPNGPKQIAIDCLGVNRPQIASLLTELTPLVNMNRPDWPAVYQRAKTAGTSIGGCVLAELVQSYLGGTRAPEPGEGWTAHETLEKFRAEEANNATFKTVCTRQDGTTQPCAL